MASESEVAEYGPTERRAAACGALMLIGTIHMTPSLTEGACEQVLEECVEQMILAEELGYYAAWVTEHHFASFPQYRPYGCDSGDFVAYDTVPDALALLYWVAARTSRIRLGTGVTCLPYQHPFQVAEKAAVLDNLSGGRVELGVGRGGGWREPAAFGSVLDEAASRRRFGEQVDVILRAWSDQWFHHAGEFYNLPEVRVTPPPLQKPHPPLYLACTSAASYEQAATRGLPYAGVSAAHSRAALAALKPAHKRYLELAESSGHDMTRARFPQTLIMYCGESDAEAVETMRTHLTTFKLIAEGHYEGSRGRFQRGDQQGKAEVERAVNSQLEHNIIGGTDTCIERLEAARAVSGVNYLLAIVNPGGVPHQKVLKSMKRFAQSVAPHFSEERQATQDERARA